MKEKVPLENRRIGSERADITFATFIQAFFLNGLRLMASVFVKIVLTPDFCRIAFQKPLFGRIQSRGDAVGIAICFVQCPPPQARNGLRAPRHSEASQRRTSCGSAS